MNTPVRTRLLTGRALALALVLLCVVIWCVHAPFLRSGHDWSDDIAQYISHALNLIASRPYGDIGYIANPWAIPGPATYPPVYPLLIAPLIALWGADLHMLKLLGVVMLCASACAGVLLLRGRVGDRAALAIMALVALSPYFVGFRDEARPDTVFLFLTLIALWLADRWCDGRLRWNAQLVAQGIALGVVAYLAYGTRSVGIVILPAVLACELLTRRRPGTVSMVAAAVALAFAVVQSLTLHGDGGYAHLIRFDAPSILSNAKAYVLSLSVLFKNGLPAPFDTALRAALFLAASVFAVIGYVLRLRRGVSVLEVFTPLYMVPLSMYWIGTMIQQRYMLPLFPIYLYYAWTGLQWLRDRLPSRVSAGLGGALAVALAIGYLSGHLNAPRGPIDPGLTSPGGQALLAEIRLHTPTDAVVLSGRARAVALYAERTSLSPYGYRSDTELWQLIRDNRVSHVMIGLGDLATDMDYEHPDDLARFAARFPHALQQQYANADFRLMRVVAIPEGFR
jgi:hypothetical protein